MIETSNAAGAEGHRLQSKSGPANASRTLMRKFKKEGTWPTLYWAQIRVKSLKDNGTHKLWHPFLLPHEWIAKYCYDPLSSNDLKPLPSSKHAVHISQVCQQSGMPEEGIIPVGLHGDGVPIQGTLNEQSLECFTVNLPCSKSNSDKRVPFTVIQKKYVVAEDTFDDIMEVFCWSMKCLADGQYPSCRHDGQPWIQSDKARKSLKGGLPAKALLTEVRGDWDFYETLLKFPAYNRKSGMCWMCPATYKDFKEVNSRSIVLTAEQFLERNASDGKTCCKLFSLPGVTPQICRPDWMHTCDLGVAADICGHL